ncbi:MAG: class I SAM-dependent methyltransferase [Candidatus Hydrogenedentes bacterium]|nr:class I SAM-dependent methyltransferase [Candidatus Hydrogenedentota bacterium]
MAGLLSPMLKRKRFAMVAPYIQGDVLDVGCGPTTTLACGGGRITSYTGIEQHVSRIAQLSRDFPEHTFLKKDLDEDALDLPQQFDTILLVAVIEHIYNQKHLMRELVSVLKPSGRIVITTPTPFGNDIVHRWGAAIGLFSTSARDDHIVVYNRKRFEILARDHGLAIERYRRFQFGCNQLVVLRKQA